jgi:hypothetical protein
MAKCAGCGCQMSGFRSLYSIVCKDCSPKWPKILAEREAAGAKAQLDLIIENHIKDAKLQVFGIAYWDTIGSKASTVFNKALGGVLLGGLGSQMTGKTHHLGVIAVTEMKLHIIEMGNLVGEEITLNDIRYAPVQGKEVCIDLKDVTAYAVQSATSSTLSISSPIQMQATFPSSYDKGNIDKAVLIADAVKSAGIRCVPGNNENYDKICTKCGHCFNMTEKLYFCPKCGYELNE